MNPSEQQQFDDIKKRLLQVLPRLLRYARNLSSSSSDAEDLLQSTSERVLSRWHQFRPGTDFDRWAFTIMRSIRNNTLRSESVRLGSGHEDASERLVAPDNQSPEWNKTYHQLLDSIEKLPENQRQVILLVYVEGYSYGAAADILGIPQGTVMSRIGRGRMNLASELNTNDPNSMSTKLTTDNSHVNTSNSDNVAQKHSLPNEHSVRKSASRTKPDFISVLKQ
ncbi:hypothetical protein AB833_02175 [Chromatiales bacterium (ex Bugula neritina AB1)]|nr:hypothetical protein AB833_02175 [Chromatiales bacterium (ex Bugula neritina AB1)]